MTKTVLGIFSDTPDAENAIEKLKKDRYNPKEISIVMKDKAEGERLASDTGTDVMGGALGGATTGAVIGGLAGLLASFVIPGLGAFFIGGPIAAALGLGGAAASTVSGAATGALAGGLLGALTGWGLSEDEAREYESRVKEGAILLAVPAREGESRQVEEILRSCNADAIRSVSPDTRDEEITERSSSRSSQYSSQHAFAGMKGGSTKSEERGWHGDSKGHSEAAKKSNTSSGEKGGRSSKAASNGRGWFGDSEAHSRAAKGDSGKAKGSRE